MKGGLLAKINNPPKTYAWVEWTDAPIDDFLNWEHWVWAHNKNFLTVDYTSNFSDPDVVSATADYATLAQTYVPDPTTFNIGQQTALATSGNEAACWGNSSFQAYFTSGSTLDPTKWLYTRFPAYPGGANPTFAAGATMEIPKNAKNAPGAWSLISWITSPRMQNVFFQQGNGTLRQSVLTAPANVNSTSPGTQIGRQSTNWFSPPTKPVGTAGATSVYCPIAVNMPQATTLASNIGNEIAKVIAGQETAAQACANLDKSTSALMTQVGYANKYKYAFGS
jgi:hypothetical protein